MKKRITTLRGGLAVNGSPIFTGQMTTDDVDAFPTYLLRNGGIVYDATLNQFLFRQDDEWIPLPAEGGLGNVLKFGVTASNNIATWAGNNTFSIQDSGVAIAPVVAPLLDSPYARVLDEPLINVPELRGLGHLKFSAGDGVGSIFVDTLTAMQFVESTYLTTTNACIIITGGLPTSGSSSVSALLEIQEGALLLPRNSTTDINALPIPVDGMMAYNSTTGRFGFRQSGSWTYLLNSIDTYGSLENLFLGIGAQNTTASGSYNFAAGGVSTMLALTTGASNLTINGLNSITEGSFNIGLGLDSLSSLTTGTNCIAVGLRALDNITGATACVAIGVEALRHATNSFNVAVGDQAGIELIGGTDNTCIGNLAGPSAFNNNSNDNTFLGSGATTTNAVVSNSTAIGRNAEVSTSNAVVLGSGCNVGIGKDGPQHALEFGTDHGMIPLIYMASTDVPADPGNVSDGIISVYEGRLIFSSGGGIYGGEVATFGANTIGAATFNNATTSVTVMTTAITENSLVFVSLQMDGPFADTAPLAPIAGNHVPGVSFTIYLPARSYATDVNWWIIERG